MDIFERAHKFREQAKQGGLICVGLEVYRKNCSNQRVLPHVRHFELGLSRGTIYCSADALTVWCLVKIAKEHGEEPTVGEHNAILTLTAVRSTLREDLVYWGYADSEPAPADFIYLWKWLQEHGFGG